MALSHIMPRGSLADCCEITISRRFCVEYLEIDLFPTGLKNRTWSPLFWSTNLWRTAVKMQAEIGWLHFQVIGLNLNPFRNLFFLSFIRLTYSSVTCTKLIYNLDTGAAILPLGSLKAANTNRLTMTASVSWMTSQKWCECCTEHWKRHVRLTLHLIFSLYTDSGHLFNLFVVQRIVFDPGFIHNYSQEETWNGRPDKEFPNWLLVSLKDMTDTEIHDDWETDWDPKTPNWS